MTEKDEKDGKEQTGQKHTLYLHERQMLTLTGVKEVTGFDGSGAILETGSGELRIEGEGLKVLRFDRETGELCVSGLVGGLYYPDAVPGEKKKTLRRLLR